MSGMQRFIAANLAVTFSNVLIIIAIPLGLYRVSEPIFLSILLGSVTLVWCGTFFGLLAVKDAE